MPLNIPNLDRLISHMEVLRPDQFDMRFIFRRSDGRGHFIGGHAAVLDMHECGTAACIAGECAILAKALIGSVWTTFDAGGWLGLNSEAAYAAFHPKEYSKSSLYPLSRALRMLHHLRAEFLRTGTVVVDWDAPEIVEATRKPWAVPLFIGVDKELPVSLTRFVGESAISVEV